ncbi:hypothetical protein [Murinocardiopsis flavida]|uniref:hypothetical protein n=1 Tax=Murinocardiopsis flavida TaxID=645275 RepID=UPI0011B1C939|nr:hypothetical protein [Murinocardiopsis flavida]
MPNTISDPAASPAGAPGRPAMAGTLLNGACGVVLLLLGFVGAVVLALAESWLSWLAVSGGTGLVLALVSLAGICCVLFAGGRAVGWATSSRWGPALLAAGWTAGIFLVVGFGSAGDTVMLASWINYAFLFGTVAVLALAALLSEPDAAGVA